MKVNYQKNRDISFNGIYNSKAVKKCLEFAAENGTLFAATTTLVLSGARPLAILATPKTDKKNKQVACAKSITSTINGYVIALACTKPFSNAIRKIDKNPKKYLDENTVNVLKEEGKKITESKPYEMATQIFKLGLGLIIAAPKSFLTAIGTPYVLNLINPKYTLEKSQAPLSENIAFKRSDNLPRGIGKILKNKKLQEFVKKHKDSNFPMHTIAATDVISTAAFTHQTSKSKKLDEKDKKPLIYNSILSTAFSIASTYAIDAATKNKTDSFIEKYKKLNKNETNLAKQVEGIKIAKPILIAGAIYYLAIPIISTFLADRIKANKK